MYRKHEAEAKLNVIKSKMILTTGIKIDSYNITKYLGLVSSESVLGTGFISEFGASFSDLLGIESTEFNEKIDRARNIATDRLLVKAAVLNADAIIGINYSYMSIGANMMAVMVTGTAVKIEAAT